MNSQNSICILLTNKNKLKMQIAQNINMLTTTVMRHSSPYRTGELAFTLMLSIPMERQPRLEIEP